MKIYLKNGMTSVFPMTVFEIQDILDKLKIPLNSPALDFSILEYDNPGLPKRLCRSYCNTDIYKLNMFAERYEKLDQTESIAFKSLISYNSDIGIDDMLLMTYGLDQVPVFPCANYAELGEIAIESNMLDELENCSDELAELLDRNLVGRRLCEQDNGCFVEGRYCLPGEYEKPHIDIVIEYNCNKFFDLLVAPGINENESTANAQWLSLPCSIQDIESIVNHFSTAISDMILCDFKSALPELTANMISGIGQIYELNDLANRLARIPREDFIKLKAIMANEPVERIEDVKRIVDDLDEYEFDGSICSFNKFGSEYLVRNLKSDFDHSVLDDVDLHDFGQAILRKKGGGITDYGAVSGRGESLYSVLTDDNEQELSEDREDEETEENDIRMEM